MLIFYRLVLKLKIHVIHIVAIPSMKDLQLGGNSEVLEAKRFRLLAWIVTGNQAVGDLLVTKLRAMPKEYIVILLTLYYLTKVGVDSTIRFKHNHA